VFIFFAVILMGLLMGIVGNSLKINHPKGLANPACCQEKELAVDPICGMSVDMNKGLKTGHQEEYYYFCSAHCLAVFEENPEKYVDTKKYTNTKGIKKRLRSVFKYAFMDMAKKIGPEIFLGLVLAALVSTIAPVGKFVGSYFGGGLGYLFSLFFGLAMYICSTASVPLVHAFISQGMNVGAGMVLLVAGPVTSWGTLLVLRKSFGGKTLVLYLTIISILALSFGYIFYLI